jgi:hypothetical protein
VALHPSNLFDTYYQHRGIQSCGPPKKILVVAQGQRLDTETLRSRGNEVTTFGINDNFKPNVLGSVHDLAMLPDASFDVITVSPVLEYLAESYLDRCFPELATARTHSLVYPPVAGRHFQVHTKFDMKGFDGSWIADLFGIFHKPPAWPTPLESFSFQPTLAFRYQDGAKGGSNPHDFRRQILRHTVNACWEDCSF